MKSLKSLIMMVIGVYIIDCFSK